MAAEVFASATETGWADATKGLVEQAFPGATVVIEDGAGELVVDGSALEAGGERRRERLKTKDFDVLITGTLLVNERPRQPSSSGPLEVAVDLKYWVDIPGLEWLAMPAGLFRVHEEPFSHIDIAPRGVAAARRGTAAEIGRAAGEAPRLLADALARPLE